MKQRVRVKMVPDKDFKPTLYHKTKVWVHLPSGEYFYIHEGHIGSWYQMYALYMDYPSEQAAVEAALSHVLHPNVYGPAQYKALRVRERVFTPDVATVKEALSQTRSRKRKPLAIFKTQRELDEWRARQAKQNVPRGTLQSAFTPAQKKLAKQHGTPAQFATDVYKCVPGDISMDEARAAIKKYNREWSAAGRS